MKHRNKLPDPTQRARFLEIKLIAFRGNRLR